MNGQELLRIVDALQRDKGIQKDVLITGIEMALAAAAKRQLGMDREEDVRVSIDRLSGALSATHNGEAMDTEILGRIAAQTAKQVMIQKFREAENDVVYDHFGKRIGELVNGIVQRLENNLIVVNLEQAEGILPRSEQASGEFYRPGERIRCLVKDVAREGARTKIVLSRKSALFVQRLFELEVPEISEKIIEIKGLEREAGFRCKVAVYSVDSRVDAVGACVGVRGSRIRTIVEELNGEKIDIIRWSENPELFISQSLKPAEISKTSLDPDEKRAEIVVNDDQLSLAIGRRGQNVRLASRLSGWEIDVVSWSQLSERSVLGQKSLEAIPGISSDDLDKLKIAGLSSLTVIKRKGLEALEKIGFDEEYAEKIMDFAYEYEMPEPSKQLTLEKKMAQNAADLKVSE
jgi:N utilization substance protein A